MSQATLQPHCEEPIKMPTSAEFTTFAADMNRQNDRTNERLDKLFEKVIKIETKMEDRDHTAEQRTNNRVVLIGAAFVLVDGFLRHFHLFS